VSPEQKRKFNTVFGGMFIATGIFAWALAAYFAVTPNPPKPAPVVNGTSIDVPSCRNTLRALGYEVTVKGKDITAYESAITEPKLQLDRATVAATVCRLPLKSFCMGEGCERPGITIVVASNNPDASTAAPAASSVASSAEATPK